MRNFKTVFFRVLFVAVMVLCVWHCKGQKNDKAAATTTTVAVTTTTTEQATTEQDQDASADTQVVGDESGDKADM